MASWVRVRMVRSRWKGHPQSEARGIKENSISAGAAVEGYDSKGGKKPSTLQDHCPTEMEIADNGVPPAIPGVSGVSESSNTPRLLKSASLPYPL